MNRISIVEGSNRELIEALLISNKSTKPITEQSNPTTRNIDMCQQGRDIVELLAECDRQIFHGWCPFVELSENRNNENIHANECYASQGNEEVRNISTEGIREKILLEKVSRLAQVIANHLCTDKKFKLIMSGCGTSGRLAYLCSQTFNSYMKSHGKSAICEPIIAGDEFALINSVESVEDSPESGVQKLSAIVEHDQVEFVYIGISCGLSAPFVAGQLDYCMSNMKLEGEKANCKPIACAIIGFNPVEMTRHNVVINSANESFLDIMRRMRQLEGNEPYKYFIINPLIGPEPITGSSRMKGGTCTKLIIDLVLSKCAHIVENRSAKSPIDETTLLDWYERLIEQVIYTKENMKQIGHLIDKAYETLNRKASVCYISDSLSLGFLGCVDASECVPTYGARKQDVQGFITKSPKSGDMWHGFVITCKSAWSSNITSRIDNQYNSNEDDMFLIVNEDEHHDRLINEIETSMPSSAKIIEILKCRSKFKLFLLNLSYKNQPINAKQDSIEHIELTGLSELLNAAKNHVNAYFAECMRETTLKLVLNAISTGAHVLVGKTYENMMIDVRVSNVKLFWRACDIIRRYSSQGEQELSTEECIRLLLSSIYEINNSDDQPSHETDLTNNNMLSVHEKRPVSEHVHAASEKELVVPKALIMGLTNCTYKQACERLADSRNSVRACIFGNGALFRSK
jgi:N-acetylmuramic acid 6-phosphate (MurNAc-6-P) etherase